MALGKQLQNAREKMKLTASEVAAATYMNVQTVEAIEREDFSGIAAPIYAKGFIKLYAEYVGMDPQPLIQEYLFISSGEVKSPSLVTADSPHPEAAEEPSPEASATEPEAAKTARAHELFPPEAEREVTRKRSRPSKRPSMVLEILKALGDKAREQWRTIATATSAKFHQVRETTREAEVAKARIRFRDMPLKVISVAAGILVILVFVASGLSRCMRKPAAEETSLPPDREEVRIAMDAPTPYFD